MKFVIGALMCASEKSDMDSPGEETGRGAPPHAPAQPNGSNKIIGRNVNGTSKSQLINKFFTCTLRLLKLKNRVIFNNLL